MVKAFGRPRVLGDDLAGVVAHLQRRCDADGLHLAAEQRPARPPAAWMANLMLEEPALRTAMQSVMAPSRDDIGATVDIDRSAGDPMRERRRQIGAGETDVHDVDEFADRRFPRRLVQQQLEILQS